MKKKKLIKTKKSGLKNNKTMTARNLISEGNKKIGIFVVKFFLIFFVFSFVVEILSLSWLTEFIAWLSASIIGLDANGAVVYVKWSSFIVGNACTGLMSASILAATIFALRKPTLDKKVGLFLIGLAILLVINIPRVSLVLLSAAYGFDANLVHELTWFLMSGVILLIWYFGTKKLFDVKDFSELI